ncbi:MAG TPA: undecaprenyl-diphosphate phosphatase [Solirubrobacteraceae bacterium]
MRSAERALPLRHALALGLLQGPTELLPVSSSGHTTLLPLLAGWPYGELDGAQRKSFEVALHAGAGVALAIHMRGELRRQIVDMDGPRSGFLALSLLPPTVVGLIFGEAIERRLGGPRSIAAGLIGGGLAMAIADLVGPRSGRGREEAGPLDGLALGLAQAAALIPGVSRSGATLAAARARGFGRGAARSLSWEAALPVIVGASALQGARLAHRGITQGTRAALAVGAISAFVSTLGSARVLGPRRPSERSLLPFALYRCLLAAASLVRAPASGGAR